MPANISDNVTAVHWACHDNNHEALRILVEYGAELEHKDNLGRAPIHWACTAKNVECLKVIIKSNNITNLNIIVSHIIILNFNNCLKLPVGQSLIEIKELFSSNI